MTNPITNSMTNNQPARGPETRARILEIIKSNSSTRASLAKTLGLSRQGIGFHVKALIKDGLVREVTGSRTIVISTLEAI